MNKDVIMGHLHPLTMVIEDVVEVFSKMDFEVVFSPEIESEYYNFDALNMLPNHPARDMQDTFWVKGRDKTVLRTHVSNTQVRYMEKHKPPFRIVYFGKVFRHEATDATHEMQFHQFETLVVEKNLTIGHLKGSVEVFIKKLFGENVGIRFRPSYFPFTEPSFEVDISFNDKWLEVLGGGMVHPNVLKNGGLDSSEWRGFAFGVGWDRIAMIKYGIPDVRMLYSGDLRLINQF